MRISRAAHPFSYQNVKTCAKSMNDDDLAHVFTFGVLFGDFF